jgi:hypothetical protein
LLCERSRQEETDAGLPQMAGDIPVTPSDGPTATSDTHYMVNAAVCDLPFGRVKYSSEVILIQEDRIRFRVAWLRPSRGVLVNLKSFFGTPTDQTHMRRT